MEIHELPLNGLKLIKLNVFEDERGFFLERFNLDQFKEFQLPYGYMQDNHSRSVSRVLRGLHFQTNPSQGKLVGVVRGKIWDVVVDIRQNSATFGQHFGLEMSDLEGLLLWVPPGFAHGFCVLGEEPADVIYKVDAFYNPRTEGGILWNDDHLNIPWPYSEPLVSKRDQSLKSFQSYLKDPAY